MSLLSSRPTRRAAPGPHAYQPLPWVGTQPLAPAELPTLVLGQHHPAFRQADNFYTQAALAYLGGIAALLASYRQRLPQLETPPCTLYSLSAVALRLPVDQVLPLVLASPAAARQAASLAPLYLAGQPACLQLRAVVAGAQTLIRFAADPDPVRVLATTEFFTDLLAHV